MLTITPMQGSLNHPPGLPAVFFAELHSGSLIHPVEFAGPPNAVIYSHGQNHNHHLHAGITQSSSRASGCCFRRTRFRVTHTPRRNHRAPECSNLFPWPNFNHHPYAGITPSPPQAPGCFFLLVSPRWLTSMQKYIQGHSYTPSSSPGSRTK